MTTALATDITTEVRQQVASRRASALATTLENGSRALADFAARLTDSEWTLPLPHDGRPLGVLVHHVATMYPVEIRLALTLADGEAITGVTWNDVHAMNAAHATEFAAVTKDAALRLLATNAATAASAIRALSDVQLDSAAPISLYGDAPLTCQFMLEDHAVRHAYHHLAKMRDAIER
jgi:hypothetical protein